jgi:hypothetical protein
MSHEKPLPKCEAMLLCDQCIVEAGTGKHSLIGVFDGFWLRQFPGFVQPFTVFLQLIEGIGDYEVVLQVHDLQHDALVAETPVTSIHFGDRLNRIKLRFPIVGLPLAHPGKYEFRVLANRELLEQQSFVSLLLVPSAAGGEQHGRQEL